MHFNAHLLLNMQFCTHYPSEELPCKIHKRANFEGWLCLGSCFRKCTLIDLPFSVNWTQLLPPHYHNLRELVLTISNALLKSPESTVPVTRWMLETSAPLRSAAIVIWPGSPPKLSMFFWVHFRAASWSKSPQFPLATVEPTERVGGERENMNGKRCYHCTYRG